MARKPQRPPLPAHAERLWVRLQSGLLDNYKAIIEIIETEAWKPTYDTFFEAWDEKLHNITFAPEIRKYVAYQMFGEGRTPDQVADAVKGITPESAETLKEQRDNAVPVDKATTRVRSHRRKLPSKWGHLTITVDHELLLEWHRIARIHNRKAAEVAFDGAAAAFETLRK